MHRRQRVTRQWLIIVSEESLSIARRLPRGSGLIVIEPLSPKQMRQLRTTARVRGLRMVSDGRKDAERVHNARELRAALSARTPLILLSPLYPTSSHPDWKPIPRMRAAALARLGGRKSLALGGMDARRFERIKRFGFQGWAGISAFRT
jgi:thiamine-phosphate pyrophosphorylase